MPDFEPMVERAFFDPSTPLCRDVFTDDFPVRLVCDGRGAADDIVQAVLRHATVLGAQVVVLATTPRRSHMALMEIAQEYNLCIITASLPLPE